jgi:Glycosyltransferase family 87
MAVPSRQAGRHRHVLDPHRTKRPEFTFPPIAGLGVVAWVALGMLLVLLAAIEVYRIAAHDLIGSDFRSTIWLPAHALVTGGSPYGPGDLAGSVYPPSAFVPLAWLGLSSFAAAATLWTIVSLAAALATLWVLDVRDWRCYLLWMLNAVTLSTALTGNATTLIVLLVALMWRYRDVATKAGAALGAAIAIKLFAAPLVLWLAFTRRYRAAAYAAAGSVLAIALAWAAIGFDGLRGYLGVLDRNNEAYSGDGPFLQGLLQQRGVDDRAALVISVLAATILLGCAWLWRADEVRSLALAMLAVLVAPPVAWVGYVTLLVIPLAVRSPRFNAWWLVFVGFAYVHWWDSPLEFRSAGLSVATLALTVVLAAAGVGLATSRKARRDLGVLSSAAPSSRTL